jgi:hypothetical protein
MLQLQARDAARGGLLPSILVEAELLGLLVLELQAILANYNFISFAAHARSIGCYPVGAWPSRQ